MAQERWTLTEEYTPGCGRHPHITNQDGEVIVDGSWYGSIDCDRARLIAAAPELLEALTALDEAYCEIGPDMSREQRTAGRKALIAARAAIAKAKGEQV